MTDQQRRKWSRIALGLSVFANLMLLWTAMRVRALGSHHGIFSFDEVGFFSTFNDGLSIAVLILGVLGAIFGYFKGYCGISDPIPGYTKARGDVEDHILNEVYDAADTTEDDILDWVDDAEDLAEDAIEDRDTASAKRASLMEEYSAACDAHNDTILRDITKLETARERMKATRHAIARRDLPEPPFNDFEVLEALRVASRSWPAMSATTADPAQSSDSIEFHLGAVRDAKARALTDIAQAVIAIEANRPDLSPID